MTVQVKVRVKPATDEQEAVTVTAGAIGGTEINSGRRA